MADRHILYRLRAALQDTFVAIAGEVEVDDSSLNRIPGDVSSVQDGLEELNSLFGIVEDSEHPITLRRDMPTEVETQALIDASLNQNSAVWILGNDQLSDSNRADATIMAQRAGLPDLDGNDIPTTAVAANTIQMRSGSVVRMFTANDYRVVSAPVFDSDITSRTDPIRSELTALQRAAFNSGRSFIRFNDGFNVGDVGFEAATVRNKNLIYTAKNQKATDSPTRPDVILPNDAEITGAGGYPYTFELTHIGGTGFSTTENLLRIFSPDGLNLLETVFFDQFAIANKPSASDDWEFVRSPFDASSFVLASGVVNILDTEIAEADQIPIELNGATIHKGDVYVVNEGGDWGQYVGASAIPDHSLLMALVDGASIIDELSNTDWFLFTDSLLDTKATALLSSFAQDGVKFTANRNVRIDPINVIGFNSQATGVPVTRELGANIQGANRRQSYANTNVQFADLVGGSLTVMLSISNASVTGFSPTYTQFELEYPGGFKFTFPLGRVDGDGSFITSTIQIPDVDYSAMLGQNPTLQSLYYDFFGQVFSGSYQVASITNTSVGELNQAVALVAQQQGEVLRQQISGDISRLAAEIDSDGAALNALQPRISPLKDIILSTPAGDARFLDSTGVDSFPLSVASMSSVSESNPRFTGGNTALFVAVPAPGSFVLNNITASSVLALDDSEASVDLGESLSKDNQVFFVYRITGLTSGHVYEVDRTTLEEVPAWPDDINNLQDDIERIDAELEHAALHLSDELIDILDNETTITEESTPTVTATDYNNQLAGPANTTQTVFKEVSPNAGSGGTIDSKPIKDTSGDRARRKLTYFPQDAVYVNQAYLSAFDGSATRDLVTYVNGTFFAKVFVPSIPSGSQTSTIYPAPSNRVSGEGVWIRVPALTFQNGIPVPEADEVFFTRNIPSTSTTLNIQYRGHANGNVFGASSTTLAGVGGSSEVATSFTLDDGNEIATVEVRYYPSTRAIRVSVTESVRAGLPTINDIEVILSYDETRTVPATPATTRDVAIEYQHTGVQVFAIKPSTGGNLILVGDRTEIDTGYAYTTLFGATESGHLIAGNQDATFLDYEDFDPIARTVTDLENHALLPQFGLFSTDYKRETVLGLGVTIKPVGLNVSDLPTSDAGLVSGDVWNNAGTLDIV